MLVAVPRTTRKAVTAQRVDSLYFYSPERTLCEDSAAHTIVGADVALSPHFAHKTSGVCKFNLTSSHTDLSFSWKYDGRVNRFGV